MKSTSDVHASIQGRDQSHAQGLQTEIKQDGKKKLTSQTAECEIKLSEIVLILYI